MNKYLFVYGTLMKKYSGHKPIHLEKYGKYVSEGIIQGRLYEIDNYPGLILSSNSSDKVYGEIFLLEDFIAAIHKLDEYEDYFQDDLENSLYVRQVEQIKIKEGETKKAWVFIFNKEVDEKKRIISGNYMNINQGSQ